MAFNCYFSCSLQRRWNVETKRALSGQIPTALNSKKHVTNNDTADAKLRQHSDRKRSLRNRHKTVLINFHHLQRIRAEEIVFFKNENENSDPFSLEAKKDGCFRRLLMKFYFSKIFTVFFVVWLLLSSFIWCHVFWSRAQLVIIYFKNMSDSRSHNQGRRP